MKGAAVLLAVSAVLAGCVEVGFRRPPTLRESLRKAEIREYYESVQLAFAQGDAAALAELFDPGITEPMTHAGILEWGRKFFAENGPSRFRIVKLSIEDMGTERAVVLLEYAVETEGGRGDFGGTELDTLVKSGGRWRTAAWKEVRTGY